MTLWDLLELHASGVVGGLSTGVGLYIAHVANNARTRRIIERAQRPLLKRVRALERAQGWEPREADREEERNDATEQD